MVFKIYDEQSLKDVMVTGSHNYAEDEFYLRAEGHDLVNAGWDPMDDSIDDPSLKRELFEHLERFTLDGKPITEFSVHRYTMYTKENGEEVYQIQVVLYN